LSLYCRFLSKHFKLVLWNGGYSSLFIYRVLMAN